MVGPQESSYEKPPRPFEGSARRGELLAYRLHLDARIKLRNIYRLRVTNRNSWLFHGKPMRLIEIRAASYCYRMKFDLTPDEITDPLDERCCCVYTDSWQPAALALTLVPTEWARRMMHMMALSGLDPGVATDDHSRTDATIEQVRKQCRECPAESFCDEWLAGRAQGDDTFCPNAATFRMLARRAAEKQQK
jgi:hypothetical protein